MRKREESIREGEEQCLELADSWAECLQTLPVPETAHGDLLSVRAADALQQVTRDGLANALSWLGVYVESPPEKAFLLAFIVEGARAAGTPCVSVVTCPKHEDEHVRPSVHLFTVCPQHKVGRYRVDVLIRYVTNERRVIVEIDGHEFHEKTREQASRDKARERAIVAAGLSVLRFSGSDVFRNASACAAEVVSYLQAERPKGKR